MKTNKVVGLHLKRALPKVNAVKLYKELILNSRFNWRERAELSIMHQCIPKRVTTVTPQGLQKTSLSDRGELTIHSHAKYSQVMNYIKNIYICSSPGQHETPCYLS